MKQLEMKLQERLLIVEGLDIKKIHQQLKHYTDFHELDLLCKGNELTEEVAKGLAEKKMYYRQTFYRDFKNDKNYLSSALDSFISAIESNGYFWGEKFESPKPNENFKNELEVLSEQSYKESRTFNPSRTLIFKIS